MKKLVLTNVDQWEGHLLPRRQFFDLEDECVVDDNEAARLTLTKSLNKEAFFINP
jgi:hypothetical protein